MNWKLILAIAWLTSVFGSAVVLATSDDPSLSMIGGTVIVAYVTIATAAALLVLIWQVME